MAIDRNEQQFFFFLIREFWTTLLRLESSRRFARDVMADEKMKIN